MNAPTPGYVRGERFQTILHALQDRGRLTFLVKTDSNTYPFRCGARDFCLTTFGGDAIEFREYYFELHPDCIWTYYEHNFYFDNEEDAVLFRIQFA
jgi:hypothetical protein